MSVEIAPCADVVRARDVPGDDIRALIGRYGVCFEQLEAGAPIETSFWGEPEAGISRAGLQFRADTPVHSVLHELCHIVCMTGARRARLERSAGGTAAEECAVCYLQILLAEYIDSFGTQRCLADMDSWGYSFREGNAAAWFAGDGSQARQWLIAHRLIDMAGQPTWRLRD
jgi:hypothetical protein